MVAERLGQPGVGGQAEVIVGAEAEHTPVFDLNPWLLRTLDAPGIAMKACLMELLKAAIDGFVERHGEKLAGPPRDTISLQEVARSLLLRIRCSSPSSVQAARQASFLGVRRMESNRGALGMCGC